MLVSITGCAGISPIDLTATQMASIAQSPNAEDDVDSAESTDFSRDIVVDGSSTVFPITTAVAEEFSKINTDVRVSVGLSGTGGGFAKFCTGETDINNASRPIKDSEKETCTENSIEWTEFIVALDGLTIMVSPDNDFLQCLTPDQLVQLLEADSNIFTWSDIDSSWPDDEIMFFIPDPDSGTRDYMVEVVEDFGGPDDLRQDENTTFASDDNVLLDGIRNNDNAFGFFGYAYYISNQDTVKSVAIENDAGDCVPPESETVQDGSYNPLARPLFIYANNTSLREKPQITAFLDFYFNPDGATSIMSDVGYSLPPDGIYDANLDTISALSQ